MNPSTSTDGIEERIKANLEPLNEQNSKLTQLLKKPHSRKLIKYFFTRCSLYSSATVKTLPSGETGTSKTLPGGASGSTGFLPDIGRMPVPVS